MLLDLMANGLRRDGVTEFAVMSGRPPCVKLDGSFQPVAQHPVSEDELIELLMTIGGLAYVDRLGPEAVSWKSVEDGLGVISIKAARREGTIHARVVLQKEAPPKIVVPAADASAFDRLLAEARQRGASDLHLVAGRPPLLRIAGELAPSGAPLEAREVEQMVAPIVPDRLRSVLERDGSTDFAIA